MDKRFYNAWFDGATNPHIRKSGIGGIITAPDNVIVAQYSIEIPYKKSSRKVEYLSLIQLTETLLDHEIYNVEIRTDYKGLCESIKFGGSRKYNKLMPSAEITQLHSKAKELLRCLNYYIINWVPREENKMADTLSRSY